MPRAFFFVQRDVKTTVKETKRARYLIYKDPISKYEKFIARFFSAKQRSKSSERKVLFDQPKKNGESFRTQ